MAGTRAEGSREDGQEVLVEGPGRETRGVSASPRGWADLVFFMGFLISVDDA